MNTDGVISSSAQVVAALPTGTVSGSSQILSGTGIWSGSAQLPSGVVSGSAQISYSGITNIPIGIVSSSAQTIANLPAGTVSGSSQVLSGTGIWSGSAQLPSGVVSGSAQTIANLPAGTVSGSSQVLSGTGIWSGSAQLPSGTVSGSSQVLAGTTIHSGSFFNGITVVSGSSQITFSGLTSIPSGLVSGSSQVLSGTGIWSGSAQLPSGVVSGSSQITFGSISSLPTLVSGSSQITFGSISSIPAGLVSGSSQISFGSISSIPAGLVSGSAQITLSSTTGFGTYLDQAVKSGSTVTFSTVTATTFTGALSGNASTATTATTATTTTGNAGSVAYLTGRTDSAAYPVLWGAAYTNTSGTIAYSCAAVTIQSSTGTLTATTFVGALTGNASSATTAAACSGNSATATSATSAGSVTNASFYRQFTVRDDRSDAGDYSLSARPTGLYAIAGAGSNGPGATYLSLIHVANGSDVAFQIAGGYTSDSMYFRGTSALQNGTGYSAWRTVIHSGNISSQSVSYASTSGNITAYTINQSVGSGNNPSFSGVNLDYSLHVNQANNAASASGGITLWSNADTTTSYIGFKNSSSTGWGAHGGITAGDYATYFVMDTVTRGWIFRYASVGGTNFSSGTNVASISNAGTLTVNGNVMPTTNNSSNLGSATYAWANLYTNDLHLNNMNKEGGNDIDKTNGNWTIQEGAENLYIINNNNGKKFKIDLTEII